MEKTLSLWVRLFPIPLLTVPLAALLTPLSAVGTELPQKSIQTFHIVTYNGENLFDQNDDARNASYRDYRISPSSGGYYSNYGEPVVFDGDLTSHSHVKAKGVIKVLQAIDATGPEIVLLQEVESVDFMNLLAEEAQHLGYVEARFTEFNDEIGTHSVGLGILSKFEILSFASLPVPQPTDSERRQRPIMKAKLSINGHPLIVYNNHWKSKSGPESKRLKSAEALQADLDRETASDPNLDYVIVGDLNSDYNEIEIIADRHNDTGGLTGINSILQAQGNEHAVRSGQPGLKYNLHYELSEELRRTAYHASYGWSSMDHIIIGPGMYDDRGIAYVDNSYAIARHDLEGFGFLFTDQGKPLRWITTRTGRYTEHRAGGFSDHLPGFALFKLVP